MNILHNIFSVGPGSFGLGTVALNLCREQNVLGHGADIWCHDTIEDAQWAELSGLLPSERIRRFSCVGPKSLKYSPTMAKAAYGTEGRIFDVVHQHSLWLANSRITCQLHERCNVPSVISPHGALEKWAIKRSSWKKKIAKVLYEKNNLRGSSCLHACSEQEIAGFREYGLTNPIAVIPNGISTAWLECAGNAESFRYKFKIPPHKRIMLFLSRITPVKGLPMLMESLHSVRNLLDDWILVIAGSDEFDQQKVVQEKINMLNLSNYVRFTGLLFDQLKRDAFEAAELFVLPTKRENYGIVVVESLGAGVPVITTKGAPWESLVTYQCGWWTDVDSAAISEALQDALTRSPNDLRSMGQRGKKLVASRYTWAQAARMTVEMYEWLLHRRERPDFVVVD